MRRMTRRSFGLSTAALAAAAAAGFSESHSEFAKGQQSTSQSFPNDFVWGCATAAYQTEGAANDDGRGPTIWDTFSHMPGKTSHGDTGDGADDSYHLYKEDIGLLRNLGANAYRMS